jgi:hypothetical protein
VSESYKTLISAYGTVLAGDMMKDNLQAVMKMFRAIETGDASDVESYISPVYLNRESVDDGRSDARGPEEFRETVISLRSSFSELDFGIGDTIVCGDRVVVVVYMNGCNNADFIGI